MAVLVYSTGAVNTFADISGGHGIRIGVNNRTESGQFYRAILWNVNNGNHPKTVINEVPTTALAANGAVTFDLNLPSTLPANSNYELEIRVSSLHMTATIRTGDTGFSLGQGFDSRLPGELFMDYDPNGTV